MKSQRGQALVETALVLPILLILLFGITDLGRVFHAYLTLDHAGREAARVAAVGAEDGKINEKIELATSSLIQDKLIKDIDPKPKANRTSGTEVTITLNYSIDLLTPLISHLIGPIKLENKTVMRVE
ncbi:TadE/TadG family type IV pilus assembly protein [Sporosarcina sp. Marseille-Q4943]|uniref:TadE/TadG family type IV pilus assembly protein n=1 Tax=Sporosarcina sp. Marseille-Q4943 TaxID=2942204 RepID=UPI00208DC6A1|nr:TadE/TadG family type IV pilus assembly protein [Sporosarcina sp. Marseille-Q4943]